MYVRVRAREYRFSILGLSLFTSPELNTQHRHTLARIAFGLKAQPDTTEAEVGHTGRPVPIMQWFLPGHAFVMSREPATGLETVF